MRGSERRRVVVVTGASAGVGRATAVAFARQGAAVALLARGEAGLEGARRDVKAAGGRALVIPTDVSDADQVEAAAALTEREFGPIDVWVNNAMVSVFSPVREMESEEYRRVTEVTYLGFVYGAQAALRRMLPRDRGKIIFVGSALAYRGIPLQSAYCAAKHAIQGFFDSLRTELLHDESQVQISMVHLPAINTPQFDWVKSRLPNRAQPVPPILQPEVAADAILFAADNDRRELWLGWPTVKAIAGNRVVPWYADAKLAREGIDSQQTDVPEDPERRHNLWEPVDDVRDHGAHGRFDDRSAESTSQLWLAKNRPALTVGGAALAAAAALAGWFARSGTSKDGVDEFERELARLDERHPMPYVEI